MADPDYIEVPHDPGRRRALRLWWQGVGYWSWQSVRWQRACDASCLLPFAVPADAAPPVETVRPTWPPGLSTPVSAQLVDLDGSGAVAAVEDSFCLGPPS